MKAPPKRAEKGSIESRILLGMSEEMREAVNRAARKEKPPLSAAEWIRRAIKKALPK